MDSADTRKTIVLIIGWAFFVLGCPPPLSVGDERDGGIGGNSPGNGGAAQGGSAGSGGGAPGVGGTNSGGSAGVGGSGEGHGGAEPVPDAGADAGDAGPTILPPPNCGAFDATCISTNRRQLPAPCQGIPYSETLEVLGGIAPFHWSITPEPAQYELQSPEARTVTIVSKPGSPPTTAETLHVTLSDSADPPHVVEVDYELPLRESCWFAYLSSDDPERPLHVRDVFLHHDIAPTTGVEAAGIDFKFSPDGRWIAFRVATAAGPRLFTYDANARGAEAIATGFECPEQGGGDAGVGAACGVVDYAWSSDSNQLAVILGAEGLTQEYVTGISGYAEVGGPGAASEPFGEVYWVVPPNLEEEFVALDYLGQLAWGGSRFIAFWGEQRAIANPNLPLGLLYATPLGFVEPGFEALPYSDLSGDPNALAPDGASLVALQDGMAIALPPNPDGSATLRVYVDYGVALYEHPRSWLSPSRRWTARVGATGALEIYALDAPTTPRATSAEGSCAGVVAWSQSIDDGRELVACAAAGGTSFFGYDGVNVTSLDQTAHAVAPGIRRAFSLDGRWFVYGVRDRDYESFFAVNLEGAAAEPEYVGFGLPPVELEFPARRDRVALANVTRVSEYPLSPLPTALGDSYTTAAAVRSACREISAADDWCGAPRVGRHLLYSPDSRSLMFLADAQTLALAQPRATLTELLIGGLLPCDSGCFGPTYAFQPSASSD